MWEIDASRLLLIGIVRAQSTLSTDKHFSCIRNVQVHHET